MDAESAGLPLKQRRGDIRLRRVERIEGDSAVAILDPDILPGYPHPNPRGVRLVAQAAMPHGIGEQLLQHEIQIELDTLVEAMPMAKRCHLGRQPFQFTDAPLERDLHVNRNALIVPYAGAAGNARGLEYIGQRRALQPAVMAATTWRGRIAFGMVSIPVRLYKAARRERARFHNVYRPEQADSPPEDEEPRWSSPRLAPAAEPEPVESEPAPVERVRSMQTAADDVGGDVPSAPLRKDQILKAFELEKDRYVVFEPREIAALRPKTSSELAIDEFVRLAEIDPVFFETSHYVEPDSGGEKPYALLFAAMSDSGYAALGSLAMHGREHAVVIRPGRRGLILHTIFYAKEVRAEGEFTADVSTVGAKERQLAVTLIEALAGPFDPHRLKNAQEERVRALIESRAPEAVPVSGRQNVASVTPPVDILEALKKSLAAARKPAVREIHSNAPAARRQRKK